MSEKITPTVHWLRQSGRTAVCFLDQTLLPQQERLVECRDIGTLSAAIERLQIRGAPALGVAGAYGVALAAWNCDAMRVDQLVGEVREAAERLRRTRPTAINLGWAIDRMLATGLERLNDMQAIRERLLAEAEAILAEDLEMGRKMAQAGAPLVAEGANLITHCHTGPLATGGYGTALGVLLAAHRGESGFTFGWTRRGRCCRARG